METIIVAILGSGALSALISGIFNLINNSKARKKEISDQLIIINNRLGKIEDNQLKEEKDQLRTQLLLMISDYPDEKAEILTLAEHYFTPPISGNWYCTSLFNRWLEANGIAKPEWFKNKEV